MNIILNMILGYIIHDAIQPTVVGRVLDKISLPADLIVAPAPDQPADGDNDNAQVFM